MVNAADKAGEAVANVVTEDKEAENIRCRDLVMERR